MKCIFESTVCKAKKFRKLTQPVTHCKARFMLNIAQHEYLVVLHFTNLNFNSFILFCGLIGLNSTCKLEFLQYKRILKE